MRERGWLRLERDQRILERLRMGHAYKEIAGDEGITLGRISQLATENGLRRRGEASNEGETNDERTRITR